MEKIYIHRKMMIFWFDDRNCGKSCELNVNEHASRRRKLLMQWIGRHPKFFA